MRKPVSSIEMVCKNIFDVLKNDIIDIQISETKSTKIPLNVEAKIFKPRYDIQSKKVHCQKKTNIDNIKNNRTGLATSGGFSKDSNHSCSNTHKRVTKFGHNALNGENGWCDNESHIDGNNRLANVSNKKVKIENVECDKYAIPLHLKAKQNEILKCAIGNTMLENWNAQNEEKFGFIPLANQKLPFRDIGAQK